MFQYFMFFCGKICTVSVKKQIIRNEIINKYRFRKHIFGLETYFSGNFIKNYKMDSGYNKIKH